MLTVTICCFDTGVDVYLSLFPGALNVKPGSFWALTSTPKNSHGFLTSFSPANLLSTWSAPDEIPTV